MVKNTVRNKELLVRVCTYCVISGNGYGWLKKPSIWLRAFCVLAIKLKNTKLMETIMILLVSVIGWIFSQWKFIIGIGIALWVLKGLQDKISFYEEKVLDIDDNVRQIAEKLGVFESDDDLYDMPTEKKTFSEIYKSLKDKDIMK